MNQQLNLFEQSNHDGHHTVTTKPKPIARRTDPATSHKAAAKANVTGNALLFLETIAKQHVDKTAYQIAAYAVAYTTERTRKQVEKHRETVRKRSGELVHGRKVVDKKTGQEYRINAGLIREVSTIDCPIQESTCTTYEITPDGKAYLKQMKVS